MRTIYACQLCGFISEDRDEVLSCEDVGRVPPVVEVGDFVSTSYNGRYGRYGWFDGDPAWVRRMPTGLHSRKDWDGPHYDLIYVVTAITYTRSMSRRQKDVEVYDGDKLAAKVGSYSHMSHFPFYHLETKAMTGEKGHRGGVNSTSGHYKLTKVDPEKLENRCAEGPLDASDLIGHTFTNLV